MIHMKILIAFATIYALGFVASIWFLNKYGKVFGLDYDIPKTYANMDDWENNHQAYTAFSLMWPVFYTISALIILLRFFWHFMLTLTKPFVNNTGVHQNPSEPLINKP